MGINLHRDLIDKNHKLWMDKPLLRIVYTELYQIMNESRSRVTGKTVELGSGMGSIREVIPDCIRTDLFPYPWLDQIENAYQLSFEDSSLSNLLMVDVFHHLRYPGVALKEFHRVLAPGGRAILMEPGFGVLGQIIYGWMHIEPVGRQKNITWFPPKDWTSTNIDYYAAQGNATWIFTSDKYSEELNEWKIMEIRKITALAYAASGGYSGPQLYPTSLYSFIKKVEKLLQVFPWLFTTRLMIVLEKK